MLLLVAQQLDQPVVVFCVGGLPAASLAEGEGVRLGTGLRVGKAAGVQVDAVRSVIGAAQGHQVALLQVAQLHHIQPAVFPQHHAAVHPALLGQGPAAVDPEVFRVHAGAVVAVRRGPVTGGGHKAGIGAAGEGGRGKIRRAVNGKRKRHGSSFAAFGAALLIKRTGRGNSFKNAKCRILWFQRTANRGTLSTGLPSADGRDMLRTITHENRAVSSQQEYERGRGNMTGTQKEKKI